MKDLAYEQQTLFVLRPCPSPATLWRTAEPRPCHSDRRTAEGRPQWRNLVRTGGASPLWPDPSTALRFARGDKGQESEADHDGLRAHKRPPCPGALDHMVA